MINKKQEGVIYCEGVKPLLVEAGPGSGKTFVIIERVKHLLKNAQPESFLVITFSRKAAKHLKDSLYMELPKEIVDKMQISTIHTFCADFLRQNGLSYTLIDDDDGETKELFIKKHRKELGFVDEFTVRYLKSVTNKFKEYTQFNVDTEKLVDYISKNEPYRDEYVDFVHELNWFKKEVVKNNGFKDDWYNAKYVQVARAYPIYLNLLDKYSYVDFDTLQKKTLELLETDCLNNYKNVLIDEFQDTDPIQARIFKRLIDSSETFTAVGDMDQRIYFFRGAYGDYFEEFSKEYGVDVYPLNINHRSTNDIIEVSEEFIKNNRGDYSHKKLEPYRNVSNNSYLLNNESNENEAKNIFYFIKYLKNNDIVENYSDIAILNKTVSNSKTLPKLIECLKNDDIPINIIDFYDLGNQDEVKSMITLLYYITRNRRDNYCHKVECEWGGLRAFNGEEFTPTMWNLSDSTKEYLTDLEEEFSKIATGCEGDIIKDFGLRGKGSSSLARIFANRDEDLIEELFKRVERPNVDLDMISDENDREFFSKLNDIRESIKVEDEKPTILEVYYKLLELGGYFREDLINDEDNHVYYENLSKLTATIKNYENYYSKHDYKGLLSFLTRMVENYGSNDIDSDGIQIMTVHKAKGLEFPVVIVPSLEKNNFPSVPKDPNREDKFHDRGVETFYTPNYCLNYKNTTEDEDNELETLEGIRVVYVAMTRARDILLLSTVGEVPEEIEAISPMLKEFDIENSSNEPIEPEDDDEDDEEKLALSYSSFSTYVGCPLKYKLQYCFDFKTSSSDKADLGSLVHRCLDAINHKLKLNPNISEDEVIEICEKVYSSKFEIREDDEDFDDFCDNILDYLDDFRDNNLEVIDSEVPFSIEFDNFVLDGKIDLIYRDGDCIKVLDYKNSEYSQSNIPKYKSQLLTYILALEKDPIYKEYNINTKQASIYLLQSNKHLELNIDDDVEISNQLDEMNGVAESINDGCFDSIKSDNCNICEFKPYCERVKNG